MFDRNWFHGRMLACGLYGDVPDDVSKDRFSSNSTRWLHSNNQSWCQSCSADQLENREHYFAVCSNRKAKQIRGEWLAKLLKYTLTKLPHLNTHLQRHFVLHPEGHLTWKGSTDKASQIYQGVFRNCGGTRCLSRLLNHCLGYRRIKRGRVLIAWQITIVNFWTGCSAYYRQPSGGPLCPTRIALWKTLYQRKRWLWPKSWWTCHKWRWKWPID